MWSAGCVLGEMLARRTLFKGKSTADQLRLIMQANGPLTEAEARPLRVATPATQNRREMHECLMRDTSPQRGCPNAP